MFAKYLKKEGYEEIERYPSHGSFVYKVNGPQGDEVVKIFDSRLRHFFGLENEYKISLLLNNLLGEKVRGKDALKALRMEAKVLQILDGTPGLPRFYSYSGPKYNQINNFTINYLGRLLPIRAEIRKQHIPGLTMYDAGIFKIERNKDVIVNAIRKIHESGHAGLDLHRGNVVITPNGVPYLIDLFKEPVFEEDPTFSSAAIGDEMDLEQLLN